MKLTKIIILFFLTATLLLNGYIMVSSMDPVLEDNFDIKFFETWLYTGYLEDPLYKPNTEEAREILKSNYLPIGVVLGVDETLLSDSSSDVRVYRYSHYNDFLFDFKYTDKSIDRERWLYSNIDIWLIKDEKENINLMGFEESPPAYEGNVSGFKSPNGKYLRKYKDIDVYYLISKDYQKSMRFWIDGYFFSITVTWGSDKETFYDSYEEFMTSEKTANLAALFSDDKDVFEYAMANVVLNIQNSENYVYGQPRLTVEKTSCRNCTNCTNCANFSVMTTLISLSALTLTAMFFKKKNY